MADRWSLLVLLLSLLSAAHLQQHGDNLQPIEIINHKQFRKNNEFYIDEERLQIAQKCECGISDSNQAEHRIGETYPNQYPWMSLIVRRYQGKLYPVTSGTLIADRLVLTSASALRHDSSSVDNLRVILGDHDTEYVGETYSPEVKVFVSKIYVHPKFENQIGPQGHDAAILVLKHALNLTRSPSILPICLSGRKGDIASGVVAGWSSASQGMYFTPILHHTPVSLIKKSACQEALGLKLPRTSFCGDMDRTAITQCYGDHGSPYMVRQGRKYFQTGILTNAKSCLHPKFHDVYTRVSDLYSFVEDVTMKENAHACSQ